MAAAGSPVAADQPAAEPAANTTSAATPSAASAPGPTISVTITGLQQALLDGLVLRAWAASSAVKEAGAALDASNWRISSEGRLAEALSITGSAGLSGDAYGQATPRFAINLSLDLSKFAGPHGQAAEGSTLQARLTESRAQVRLAVVAAFARLLVARAAAEDAALILEHAEAAFVAAKLSLDQGVGSPEAALDARLAVNRAALALLGANADVMVALEALAALVAMPAAELLLFVSLAD